MFERLKKRLEGAREYYIEKGYLILSEGVTYVQFYKVDEEFEGIDLVYFGDADDGGEMFLCDSEIEKLYELIKERKK